MTDISQTLPQHVQSLINRYPLLASVQDDIIRAYLLMERCYTNKGKLLIAGNGGSAADAEHIVGELMKGFKLSRTIDATFNKALLAIDPVKGKELSTKLQSCLPAMALHNHPSLNTAYLNDMDGLLCFAQQVYGYGEKEDIFLGISTSGNAGNVVYAAIVAKTKGMPVIGLTGATGGELAHVADITVKTPETETYKVQELHLPIYHCWCLMLEEQFFG